MRRLGDAVSAFRSGKGLKGQLLRGGVGSLAVKLGSTLLNVLLAVVLARTLGAEGFGIYSFVFALITILAIPAQMGLPNLVVRETAKAQANGDWALMKGLWRWSTLMALAMSLALMAIGALAAWLFASRLPDGGLAVFYWGLVLVPLVALGNLRGAALRGLRHVVQGQLPEFILRPAFLILLVLGAHFGLFAQALTASDAMMLHALASLMAFGIGAWLLLRARPRKLVTKSTFTFRTNLWLTSAIPLGMADAAYLINQNIGILILGWIGSPDDVALLRIGLQASMLISIGLAAANIMVSPHIAQLYVNRDLLRMQKIATLSANSIFSASIIIMLILALNGNFIINSLFGEEYSEAYLPMIVLCIGQMANSFTAIVGTILNMCGQERSVYKSLVLAITVNSILCIILIPHLNALGAAISGCISVVFYNIILAIISIKLVRIDCTPGGVFILTKGTRTNE